MKKTLHILRCVCKRIIARKIYFTKSAKCILIFGSLFCIANSFAQVGISSTSITPDASSILELRSTTLGFLPPRMTSAERDAIVSAVTGLVVYNTTTSQLNYYDGTSWQLIIGGGITTVPGNAGSATLTAITDDNATAATMYPTWVTTASGNQAQKVSSTKLSFNPSTGTLTSVAFAGPLTGNVTGNVTGSSGSTTGNAATVTTNANLTGDVTSVGNATTIAANAVTTADILAANVTYAKIQNVSATNMILGRATAGAGVVEEIPTTGTGNVVRAISPTLTGTPTLPTGTIATTQAAGNNSTAIATTAFVAAAVANTTYRTILQASGSHTAARVAGTYALGMGDPLAVSGTGTLYPIAAIYIAAADYPAVNGVVTDLRIRAQVYVNNVAPTGNFTFGLYPVTRPGSSGGAGLNIYTIGAVVAGSNGATFTAPAVDGLLNAVSADFALPADGHYIIGVVSTATVAASSHLHMTASLQFRNN